MPVPAIVTQECFALAQERLHANKISCTDRTITPSVVQGQSRAVGVTVALYRKSTRSSARKICHYRCLGSDHCLVTICDSKPLRQEPAGRINVEGGDQSALRILTLI